MQAAKLSNCITDIYIDYMNKAPRIKSAQRSSIYGHNLYKEPLQVSVLCVMSVYLYIQ